MTEQQFQIETGLEIKHCISCGIRYSVPVGYIGERKKDHKTFYCPNGHPMYFPHETEEERLERKVNYLEKKLDRCQLQSRTLDYRSRYYKGKLTQIAQKSI